MGYNSHRFDENYIIIELMNIYKDRSILVGELKNIKMFAVDDCTFFEDLYRLLGEGGSLDDHARELLQNPGINKLQFDYKKIRNWDSVD